MHTCDQRPEVALDTVQSCQTVHAYRDVLRTIAAGEVPAIPWRNRGAQEGHAKARTKEGRDVEIFSVLLFQAVR